MRHKIIASHIFFEINAFYRVLLVNQHIISNVQFVYRYLLGFIDFY